MPASIIYVHEKLSQAVHALATGLGPIRERMPDALAAFITIGPPDFPEELQGEFEDLIRRASADEAEGDEGNYAATLAGMSDNEVAALANDIISLEYRVDEVVSASR